MNCALGEECTSLLSEITYLKLRLAILESKSGDCGNDDVLLTKQLVSEKQKVGELKKQLEEKDEILKEAECVILQLENIRIATVENYQAKIEQLENKNATNDKLIKRLQEDLKSAHQKNSSLTQKMCQLELENVEHEHEVSRQKEHLLEMKMKNVEHKALINRRKNIKLNRLKENVKELRLHFKMCDDIANIKMTNQCKVIDKLNSELNEMKDMQHNLLKIIFDCQSSLKSETNESAKIYQAYDTPMFWQMILRDYKSHEKRLISSPKNIVCHSEVQLSYMPQVYMPYRSVVRKTRSIGDENVDDEQRKHNFSKILRAFGRFSVHGVQIGAYIYIKYLNIGRIDDTMQTLKYLKNMSI